MAAPEHPRRATIADVAELANVSVATVSRALRGLPNVAAGTRAAVVAAADQLDYQVDPIASRLASGRTLTIGLVSPFFNSWYASHTVAGVEEVLSVAGYDLLICSLQASEDRDRFLQRTSRLRQRVDGLLLLDFEVDAGRIEELARFPTPVVTIGYRFPWFSSFTTDNRTAARAATRHLVHMGHRRIALIGGQHPSGHRSAVHGERRAGYVDALAEAGIEIEPEYYVDGSFTAEGGARAARLLVELAIPPTGIVCMSDEMAFGALRTARELGLDVPEQLSVIGFDDHEVAASIGMTTMRQRVVDTGARAAAKLLRTLAEPDDPIEHEVTPVELVVRETTAPPHPALM